LYRLFPIQPLIAARAGDEVPTWRCIEASRGARNDVTKIGQGSIRSVAIFPSRLARQNRPGQRAKASAMVERMVAHYRSTTSPPLSTASTTRSQGRAPRASVVN